MPTWFARPKSSRISSAQANGISHASRSGQRSPDLRILHPCAVDAPRTGAGRRDVEEDEAEKDRIFAHVGGGPEAFREVADEIRECHFARGAERRQTGKQTDGDEYAGD